MQQAFTEHSRSKAEYTRSEAFTEEVESEAASTQGEEVLRHSGEKNEVCVGRARSSE